MASSAARTILRVVLLGFALTAGAVAYARPYPDKPVHFVLGLSVGTSTDTTARIIAQKLGKMWGQPVLVFNRPGASGTIAADLVAKAPPDGYTLLLSSDSIAVAPSYYKTLPYDPVTAFVPVSQVTSMPDVVCVNPSLPVHSIQELIALAKSNPDNLTFGSLGVGQVSHIATELFAHMTDIRMRHIPYPGSGPLLNALVTGEVALEIGGLGPLLPLIKAGRIRCIAVTSETRSPVIPDIPTMAESGVQNYDMGTWAGVFAPAGTPQSILKKVSRDIAVVLKMPDVRKRLLPFGLTPIGSTPTQFKKFFTAEVAMWAHVIKVTGIRSK